MSGREAAQKLIKDIVWQHGYVRAATMDRVGAMSQEDRREIEDAFLRKDELIGANVITLARNLYSSNARFVFELLQNADDNCFEKASRDAQIPCVSFGLHLHQNRIVVECNEDGFTKANLVAISHLGKSSKSNSQAYIGEKGIGFKSIFKVAYKVLIQSGDYTFSFNHKKGDSGMGMICPEWEPDVQPLHHTRTRMTLYLHEDEQSNGQSEDIRDQFKDIHEEMLLFLKNLKKIIVCDFDETDSVETTTTYRVSSTSDRRKKTTVTTKCGNETEIETKYFHVTKYMATDLPRSETRDYAQAEVVLAFPLSKNSVPLKEDQSVFAFLPLCDSGFKFVLHADFVTTANRQDVERTSLRNKKLISGISNAFVKGVTQLCDHQSLQYQWMRYVPSAPSLSSRGTYWNDVATSIRSRLQSAPLLWSSSHDDLHYIEDLRRLTDDFVREDGRPLFNDIVPEIYLSPHYSVADRYTLTSLGLQDINMMEILARVSADVSSPFSLMGLPMDEDWHSRVARLLALPFQQYQESQILKVRGLKLLPLKHGSWTSAKAGPVYYPETQGLEIPGDIGIKLLCPRACSNVDREALFDHLGAQVAPVQLVRDKILRRYKGIFSDLVTRSDSMAHLRYLYLSHHLSTIELDARHLRVVGQSEDDRRNPFHSETYAPFVSDTYIPCDNELSASKLLAPTPPGFGHDDGAPGFKVQFVDKIYLRNAPDRPSDETLTWTGWLCEHLKLRTTIRLVDRDEDRLTDACLYVAEHRPRKFLAMLNAVWASQKDSVLASRSCVQSLRSTKVLCQNGRYQELHKTYIPTESSKQVAARFLMEDSFFPWLQLEETLSHPSHPQEWDLITNGLKLGFTGTAYRTNVQFCLDLLCSLKYTAPASPSGMGERMYDLCLFLEAKVCESFNKAEAMYKVYCHFVDNDSIYIPCSDESTYSWANVFDCLWDSPLKTMKTRTVLRSLYSQYFPQFVNDESQWESFFKRTLKIEDCSWYDIAEELENAASSESPDLERVIELYSCLNEMSLDCVQEQAMLETFNERPLICSFVDDPPSWHTISECLWQSATRIPGKTPLNNNDDYRNLKSFFLGRLKVPKMTIAMLYGKLTSPSLSATIEEIKGDLLEFNALLGTSKKDFDPETMRNNKIFPVKRANGEVTLVSAADGFSINDRSNLAEHFAEKAAFLDFEMATVHRLRPFLEWVRLEQKYLSRSVKEVFIADKESTRPLSQPDRAISVRAHALLRIAARYGSPRVQDHSAKEAFYRLLRSSETLETNNINTTMILSQGEQSYSVDTANGNALQIDHDGEVLRIYLPRDETDRELCFHSKLSKYLFDWMMDLPTGPLNATLLEGLRITQGILTANPIALLGLLDVDGIPDVPVGEHDTHASGVSVSSDDVQVFTPSNSSAAASVRAISVPLRPEAQPQPRANVAYASPPPVFRQPAEAAGAQYRDLIRRVVTAGRRAEIPSQGAFNMSQMQETLNQEVDGVRVPNDYFVLRHTDRMERDRMIGAAGEVFVFEMLSRLGHSLPNFGRDNWQSTIRHYVDVHEDYADLGSWAGYETADITYSDTTGALTALLADKGHLNAWAADSIAQARPQFFIEVKATTGRCDTPFYMSKNQYRRMQESSQTRAQSRQQLNQVYVIFRVYNLGLDSIGVRVLVDPEGMRQREELKFTAESWTVTTDTTA